MYPLGGGSKLLREANTTNAYRWHNCTKWNDESSTMHSSNGWTHCDAVRLQMGFIPSRLLYTWCPHVSHSWRQLLTSPFDWHFTRMPAKVITSAYAAPVSGCMALEFIHVCSKVAHVSKITRRHVEWGWTQRFYGCAVERWVITHSTITPPRALIREREKLFLQ